jgi:hypothetical protein
MTDLSVLSSTSTHHDCGDRLMLNVALGSKVSDQSRARERPLTVLSRHTDTYAECRIRVDSRRLAKSYIELVPTSEFVTTTDIRRTPGQEHVVGHCTSGFGPGCVKTKRDF